MRWKTVSRTLAVLILAGFAGSTQAWSQTPAAPPSVAVRAGKLFDPKSGTYLTNQIVIITGERITDVGSADRLQVPAGARGAGRGTGGRGTTS